MIKLPKFSLPKKRSVSINGHLTSFTLEDIFWDRLKQYCAKHEMPIARFIAELDAIKSNNYTNNLSLSSMIRQFILHDLQGS